MKYKFKIKEEGKEEEEKESMSFKKMLINLFFSEYLIFQKQDYGAVCVHRALFFRYVF